MLSNLLFFVFTSNITYDNIIKNKNRSKYNMGIKYNFDVYAELHKHGFNTYYMQQNGFAINQQAMTKIKNGDTNISVKTLSTICELLDMQPAQIIRYEKE